MHTEKIGAILSATFETEEDYEMLISALECTRKVVNRRKRREIIDLTVRVVEAAPKPFNHSSLPLMVFGNDLTIVFNSINTYTDRALRGSDEMDQAEARNLAHALDVKEQIEAAGFTQTQQL